MPIVAFTLWPLIVLAMFASMKTERAVLWSILAGYLLLPEAFNIDPPGIPEIDKTFVVVGSAVFGVLLTSLLRGRTRNTEGVPDMHHSSDRLALLLFSGLLLATLSGYLGSALTNQSPITIGGLTLKGSSLYDGFAKCFATLMLLGPFFLARRYLRTPEQHREILVALVIAGMLYSMLALVEIRLSPQLHKWVYGYFQHSFSQHIRGGGFRPIVFLQHGLWLGFFFCTVAVAAFSLLLHSRGSDRAMYFFCGFWILAVMLLSKVVGALAIAIVLCGTALVFGRRIQITFAVVVAVLFLAYPVVRQAQIIPYQGFVSMVSEYSGERAGSLGVRLDNEEALLQRALEKPLFGWGGWGRWRVYDERGEDRTTSDGIWIIELGESGWFGYFGFFGLLCYPIFLLGRAWRRKGLDRTTTGLALIMTGNLIYMIPNATLTPLGTLVAGALAGFVEFDAKRRAVAETETSQSPDTRSSKYTRFPVRPGLANGPAPVEKPSRIRRRHRTRLT